MKKILITLLFSLFLTISSFGENLVFAEKWCEWSGTQGINCQDISKGYITMSNGLRVAAEPQNLMDHGFYHLIITEPILGENQIKNSEVWGFVNDEITLTWTVRDLTTTEIDQQTASIMNLSDYLQWKLMVNQGLVTAQQLRTYLETKYPEIIDAYEAWDRLENP